MTPRHLFEFGDRISITRAAEDSFKVEDIAQACFQLSL